MAGTITGTVLMLSGMPASGKDTITACLQEKYPEFVHFKKHKSDAKAEKDSYINISPTEFEDMSQSGAFLQQNQRYGYHYGIHKDSVSALLAQGKIPVIHSGKVEGFMAFQQALQQWQPEISLCHILLWQDAPALCQRIYQREQSPENQAKRIKAMEEEFWDNIQLLPQLPYGFYLKNENIANSVEDIRHFVAGMKMDSGEQRFLDYLTEFAQSHEKGV